MAKRKIRFKKPNFLIKQSKIGAVLLVLGFGLLFFTLVLRYSYIMLTGHSSGEDLIMKANEKYLVQSQEQPERGKIYDRNGKVLAEDVERYKVVAIVDKKASEGSEKPKHVKDKKETAKKLATVIDMSEEDIEKRLDNKKAFQVEFGQKGSDLTYQEKEKIEKMNLPGVTLYPETERFYPNGNFASHLIGIAQKDADTGELNGAMGVEKIFDSYLSGQKGALSYIHDIWGYIAPNTKKEKTPQRGDDVHLTIDSNIQVFVEEALDGMVEHYKPKDLFAVVMDADTGEILAYSQRPTFNPETGEDFGKKWANDLYQNTYEPGSTFKNFGLAAAIEEGEFKPDKKYTAEPKEVMGSKISDWNKVGWGEIPMSLGFTYSSNTLMMHLQDLVGSDKMKEWYEKFGFGESTNGMFDGEATGDIAWDNEAQQKTSAFGQSTTVTPVQMLQAQSAFYNEGNMLKPWFIDSVSNPVSNDTFYKGEKEIAGKPIKKDTAKKVRTEMDKVVNSEKSNAKNYRIDGYEIEGKTGTAQVADPDNGGYVEGENPYFVSFIGDAPKDDPEVVVYAGMSLAQKNDQEAYESGVSKAFKPIMENTLKYLNVGDKNSKDKSDVKYSKVPDVEGQETQKAQDKVNSKSLEPIVIGDGEKITKQSVTADKEVLPNSRVLLLTDGDVTMPNMSGWTKEEVVAFEKLTNTKVTTKGSGFVSEQSITEGQKISKKDNIEVTLSSEEINGETADDESKSKDNEENKEDKE
ncbi:penicillin-binding transpeptidase domain-containing protein [Staphylococcus equorum]|uniref:Penicillin-binding protein n=1 Tax=Staphylococcus equorum TaxID=246432 RepID=A0AAP7IFA5_9STAP|nr:penicillin-binding transpeptidase domain-containing protein [Staphylococcus equorum]ERH35942.1 penicillin-binding protein 1 [Staphylococcus equorum UMC-CNS-924]MCE5048257.1 penicillin-binding protein [Staphylococcus equorum]MDK9862271.1 penicillin-binding transpeptidase domain-containing protein [Staphylococcus equorum]MDK9869110.1 penicillin-binding transpeptidase domain-containing protein [Staphylococcus equorum]MEB7671140.1 penicillin-binding protein [Staphylococcus equorum]